MVILTDIFVSLGLISILIFVRPTSTLIAITIFGIFGIVYFLVFKKKIIYLGKTKTIFRLTKNKIRTRVFVRNKRNKNIQQRKIF